MTKIHSKNSVWFQTHRSLGGVLVQLPPIVKKSELFFNESLLLNMCLSKLNFEFRMNMQLCNI